MAHHRQHLTHWLHFSSNKKSRAVLSLTVLQFSIGLSAVFVPILLFDIGYSLREISLFYILWFVFKIAIQKPTFDYIGRVGVSHALAMSYMFGAFYILGVYIAQWESLGLIIAGVFGALHGAFLWGARHTDLVRLFSNKRMGHDVSWLLVLNAIALLIGPIIGGLVSEYAGPGYALLLTFVGLVAATVVIQKEIDHEGIKPKAKIQPLKYQRRKRDALANIASVYSSTVAKFMWPIYVFLVVGSFESVGFLFAIGAILVVVTTRIVGRYLDQHGAFWPMFYGIFGRSVVGLLRAFSTSFAMVLTTNVSSDFVGSIRVPAWLDRYYSHAQKSKNDLGFVRYMEIAGDVGAVAVWTSLFIISGYFSVATSLKLMFLLGAVIELFGGLINYDAKQT